MKIANHKYHPGLYILCRDDGSFAGAGVGFGLGDNGPETRILWYSGTADGLPQDYHERRAKGEYIPDKSVEEIIAWVKELNGKESGQGDCTKNQRWIEWRIPMTLEEMLKKYLDPTIKY